MADIFISYSKADQDEARLLAVFLEAEGYSVWWDASLLSGDNFRKTIMTELGRARAAIVIWTEHSIQSDWVQSEAGRAHADRKLIPVKTKGLSYKDIPPPFDNMHIENATDREKILAAVVAQLAKPESLLSPGGRLLKTAQFQVLSWIGLVGGILTLATHIQSAVTLTRWAHYLLESWTSILTYFWKHLLFFLPEVGKSDAMILTLTALIAINIFLCARRKDQMAVSDRISLRKSIKIAILVLAIFVIFVVDNPGLYGGYYTKFIMLYGGGEQGIRFVQWVETYLRDLFGFNVDIYVVLWSYLFLMCVIPVLLVYFVMSRIFAIRLSVAALSNRLSRIVIGVGIVVALNYIGVWVGRLA